MGDFNLDLLRYNDNVPTQEFIDRLFTYSTLYPLISNPTRITSHTATLIDNIYSLTNFLITLLMELFRGAGRTEKRRGQNLEKGTRSPKARNLVGCPGAPENIISRVSEMPFHAFWADI